MDFTRVNAHGDWLLIAVEAASNKVVHWKYFPSTHFFIEPKLQKLKERFRSSEPPKKEISKTVRYMADKVKFSTNYVRKLKEIRENNTL